MNETRDDLREALARAIGSAPMENADLAEPGLLCDWLPDGTKRTLQGNLLSAADAALGVFAPILAQVSALQAEVETLKRTLDEAIIEVDPPLTDGVWSGSLAEAIRAERTASQALAERARAERDEAIKDMEAAEAHAYGLDEKLASLSPHGTCACSYDRPGDVCMHHSPALTEALAEVERLQKVEGERDAAIAALKGVAIRAEVGASLMLENTEAQDLFKGILLALNPLTETREGSDA